MVCFDGKTLKNQEKQRFSGPLKTRNKESGSALIFIFLAIALFAAVSYTMSSGMRSGEKTISDQRAGLLATEIINHAQTIREAVKRLQINGCDFLEISYQATTSCQSCVGCYANANSPGDQSCHVFSPGDGNVPCIAIPEDAMASNPPASNDHRFYQTFVRTQIRGIGVNNQNDIIISVEALNQQVCEAINKKVLGTTQIETGTIGGHPHVWNGGSEDIRTGGVNLQGIYEGQTNGCALAGDGYAYFHVLFPR